LHVCLKTITNENLNYGVPNPARISDSTGKFVTIKNLVMIMDDSVRAKITKYHMELIPELVDLLKSDTTRDWAANLLLYNITEKDALVLKYQAKNLAKWRVKGKLTETCYSMIKWLLRN
jgi:hypothetical protein